MGLRSCRRVLSAIVITTGLQPIGSQAGWLDSNPETYSDCILQQMPKAQNKTAALMIRQACEDKHAAWKQPSCITWIAGLRGTARSSGADSYSDKEIYEYLIKHPERDDYPSFTSSCPAM